MGRGRPNGAGKICCQRCKDPSPLHWISSAHRWDVLLPVRLAVIATRLQLGVAFLTFLTFLTLLCSLAPESRCQEPEPVDASDEKASEVASGWFSALLGGRIAVAMALSDVPFAFDRATVVETFSELEDWYQRVVEQQGVREVAPDEVMAGAEATARAGAICDPSDVTIVLVIEEEAVVVCVGREPVFRVVGFQD